MRLTDFRVFTFDCYGTLIDWESGIYNGLRPLLAKAPVSLSRNRALEMFAQHESAQEVETPDMLYSDVLATVHRRLARVFDLPASDDEHRAFGRSVPDWPAFAHSASSQQYLKKYYQLVIRLDVNRESLKGISRRLAVEFDAIYTAQDVGFYERSLAKRGVGREVILHAAQSVVHDHAPAQEMAWPLPGSTASISRKAGVRRCRRGMEASSSSVSLSWRTWCVRIRRILCLRSTSLRTHQ